MKIFAAFAVLASLALGVPAVAAEPGPGVLSDTSGYVAIAPGDRTELPGTPGSRLGVGQHIVTGTDSGVAVTFPDGAQLSLGPNSWATLNAYEWDGRKGRVLITTNGGSFRWVGGKMPPGSVTLRSLYRDLVTHGTVIVSIVMPNGSTIDAVWGGGATVRSLADGREFPLPTGTGATFSPAGIQKVEGIKPLSESKDAKEFRKWLTGKLSARSPTNPNALVVVMDQDIVHTENGQTYTKDQFEKLLWEKFLQENPNWRPGDAVMTEQIQYNITSSGPAFGYGETVPSYVAQGLHVVLSNYGDYNSKYPREDSGYTDAELLAAQKLVFSTDQKLLALHLTYEDLDQKYGTDPAKAKAIRDFYASMTQGEIDKLRKARDTVEADYIYKTYGGYPNIMKLTPDAYPGFQMGTVTPMGQAVDVPRITQFDDPCVSEMNSVFCGNWDEGLPAELRVKKTRIRNASISALDVMKGSTSEIGSGSNRYTSRKNYIPSPDDYAPISTQPIGIFLVNAQNLQETAWVVIQGSEVNYFSGNSFGPITAPGGAPIVGLNNSGVFQTQMVKEWKLGNNQRIFSLDAFAKFVTTEYPNFIGSQFNDTAKITLTTPGGQSLTFSGANLFGASVNASTFTAVSNLPAPLAGTNPNNGGGQTTWQLLRRVLRVAPGGRVRITVQVNNVGDTLYPSEVLLGGVKGSGSQ